MIEIFVLVLGFIFLIKGADFLIEGSSNIARKIKISEFVIGLTIVAIGTSLPELVVSIKSVNSGHDDLLMGNIMGSCVYNLLLILGIISIKKSINIRILEKNIIILMLFSFLIVGLLGNIAGKIYFYEGIMLILFFIIFLITTLSEKSKEEKIENQPILKSIFLFLLGLILLKYGGDYIVDSASNIARKLNISEKIIGTTIIALGTSLPELATSLIAIKKDNTEIAIGNIIGSNIFNLLLVLGITSIIKPVTFSTQYNSDIIYLIIVTLIIIISSLKSQKEEINKKEGIILLTMFILYNIKLLIF